MKVARIEAQGLLPGNCVTQIELMRSHDIAFGTKSEQLAFDGIDNMCRRQRLRENQVQ